MKITNIKQGILSTLAFFDIFKYPLTAKEIDQHLLGIESNLKQIKTYLKDSRIVESYDECYYLGRQRELVTMRKKNEKIIKKNWAKIHKINYFLSIIPYIKMVGICNNLAFGSISSESDIDLFIVTKKNRLFTARFFVTSLIHALGMRRHHHKIAGRFCLSFFITENKLNLENLPIKPFDIYLAYWIKTLQPILGEDTYLNFFNANKEFLTKYFKNHLSPNLKHLYSPPKFLILIKNRLEKILDSKFGDNIEKKLKNWQLKRALEKKEKLDQKTSGIIINDDMLKFHNIDKRQKIFEKWKNKMNKLLAFQEGKYFEYMLNKQQK